ncbi:MAG: hypothetical protein WCG12_13730, partial [Alcaligenaceae bacterium]
RYAGPREALLHALFRQNYGCSDLIVGRDHAGVGSYYGPFDAHHIFDEIPKGSLETQPLKIDWTFWCYRCGGMASARTCPHGDADRLLLSGTKLRKMLSEDGDVPPEFSRPEVLEVLRAGVLVNRVVGARRQVLVTVTAPIAQASHAQRLAVMTGSPRGRRRTSRAWALQSRHEATARSPLSPHSCVNRWYSKTFLLNSC